MTFRKTKKPDAQARKAWCAAAGTLVDGIPRDGSDLYSRPDPDTRTRTPDKCLYGCRTAQCCASLREGGRSCPKRWCKSADHGLSLMMARAAAQAAAMRLGLACGSSLKASSVSRLR